MTKRNFLTPADDGMIPRILARDFCTHYHIFSSCVRCAPLDPGLKAQGSSRLGCDTDEGHDTKAEECPSGRPGRSHP